MQPSTLEYSGLMTITRPLPELTIVRGRKTGSRSDLKALLFSFCSGRPERGEFWCCDLGGSGGLDGDGGTWYGWRLCAVFI